MLAVSCAKDEKATFKASDVTAPVLGEVNVGKDIVVNYTPAVFSMSFNEKMPVYHTLGMVSVNDVPCDVTLSAAKDANNALTLKGTALTKALKLRGCEPGEASVKITVRASIQDPSKGVTNGYVDSEAYELTWTVPEEGEGDGDDDLPELSGYAIFVDNSEAPSYEKMALYVWGPGELFGGWPGMQPTGTIRDKSGITWTYFDTGADNNGAAGCNFIINNNGAGKQLENFDVLKGQSNDRHRFFKITDDNLEEVDKPEFAPALPDIDLSKYEINTALAGAETWGIIGPAQAGGWDTDTDMDKISDDPEVWMIKNFDLGGDKFKFRGNDEWKDYDLGGGTFALDTVMELSKGGGDMMANAGTYTIYLYPQYLICYIIQ